MGHLVEADRLSLRQGGLPIAAIAIDPFHNVEFLPRDFDEIPQESLFIFRQVHVDELARACNAGQGRGSPANQGAGLGSKASSPYCMPANSEIPRRFFFLDRTYSYPTLHLAAWDGKEVQVEKMFLNSGATVSGRYILRVIASPMHGRVDLLAEMPSNDSSWVMLTEDEAQLVIATSNGRMQAHASEQSVMVK